MKLQKTVERLVMQRYFWLITGLVYVVARSATWLFPFDSDHWVFYYVGNQWLWHHKVLYLQVWDHKAPLIFFINGLMGKVFGDSIVWHRIFLTAISLLTMYLFYRVSLRLLRLYGAKNWQVDSRMATLVFVFWSNLS